MNLSELNIRRPVMTTLVMSSLVIFGIMAFKLLPVSDLPNVDFPTIQVIALLPGANPETMASAVATPLERQFSTIAGIDSMSSTNSLGTTVIMLQFSLERNIDAAAQDVQAAITQAMGLLPPDMPNPPSFQKVNPAVQPILYMALTSSRLPMSLLDEYGQTNMAQRISTVNGVAQVQVYGTQKYAVRIQLDPEALASRKIGIDEVAAAVAANNVNLPTGILYGAYRAFTVQASGQLTNADAYRPMVVAYRKGYPVRLDEIGAVSDSVENNKTAAWYCDPNTQQRAVILAVQRQPGTNTVAVANAVKALLPTFRQQLPASVDLNMLYDRSISINNSVEDVEFTLWLTLGLVVLVIFLFLRNFSATIIPSLALPLSVVGTFIIMYLLNYSLDNLSLMALTLSVGFVIDDAIVVLENIVRHMEMGKNRMQAAMDGTKEVGFTIVSMTLSLSAVFIPMVFMGGIVGRLFREFAVTIGAAVIVSGFVSLTLTPMLSSRFLRPPAHTHGPLFRASERVFQWLVDFYGWTLRPVLRHKFLTILVSAGVLYGTYVLFKLVPSTFMPSEDQGMFMCFTEAAEGISFDSMVAHQQAVNNILQKEEGIESFMSTTGGMRGGFLNNNEGIIFCRMKPRHERKLSVDQTIEKLRPVLNTIPGILVKPQNPAAIRTDPRLAKGLYQFTLVGPDTKELYAAAERVENALRGRKGFLDVSSDLKIRNPQVNVNILRDKASTYGVTAGQIENALYYAYGTRQISTILAPNNQYQVIMELLPQYQTGPVDLGMLYVRASTGQLVPLKAVADLKDERGPLTVNHQGQLPAVMISFNLDPGDAARPAMSLEQAVREVNALTAELVPATITASFQGTAQAFQSSMSTMPMLLLLAILVIYMVLGILYESFIHPITILTALPFAFFGALLTLYIFRVELSLYAFVGIIMLVGLVKKNGIMMVDFAIEAQNQGKSPRDAIYEACLVRFRPITMTTVAALVGTLPIAVGYGAGAESRQPLGLAVVGGLLFSQSITLYVTPVFFLLFDSLNRFLGRVFSRKPKVQLNNQ